MYEVGEYIVHPGQGVCKIDSVVKAPEPTYMLLPVTSTHGMKISFPVANEDRLRPVLSGDEARAIIDEYPAMEPETHTERSNALEEQYYKEEIRNGDCRDSVRIMKTIELRVADLKERGKRPPVAYERVLKRATERIHGAPIPRENILIKDWDALTEGALSELAVALDMTQEDVQALFRTAVGEDPTNN